MSEPVAALPEVGRPARSRSATRAVWVERLHRFATADVSPALFCAQEGVSLPSFYSWKRRLATEALGHGAEPTCGRQDGPRLLPVRIPPQPSTVELVLPGGAILRLRPDCDLAFVRSLALALGGASC